MMRNKLSIFLITIVLASFSPWPISAESAGHVVVSEVKVAGVSGQSTDEFVELYNPTEEIVELAGWSLAKKTASGSEYELVADFGSLAMAPHGFLLVVHAEGYLGNTTSDINYSGSSSLSNDNSLFLRDSTGAIIDLVGWGSAGEYESEALINPGNDKSFERKAFFDSQPEDMANGGWHEQSGNSHDADNNSDDFIQRQDPEPQNSASPAEEPVIPVAPEEPEPVNVEHSTPKVMPPKTIRLSELFPNPAGPDDGEFLELENYGTEAVDLAGWQLTDNSSRIYTVVDDDFDSTIVQAGGFFLLAKQVTGLSLNNSNETVFLHYPDGEQVDQQSYTKSEENKSYCLVAGFWVWTDEVTPGKANIHLIDNDPPIAEFEASKTEVKVREVIEFDAGISEDPDGDKLEYYWDFGEGSDGSGKKTEHSYGQAGSYLVTLTVRDESGETDSMTLEVLISDYDYSDKVLITELLPSCGPSDQECEFIEVYNGEGRTVNLDGWQLTDGKKYFMFDEGWGIQANTYVTVSREDSKITLNNGGDKVYLIDPAGNIVSGLEYGKAKKDFSFCWLEGGWHWTASITPGEENEFFVSDTDEQAGSEASTAAEEPGDLPVLELNIRDVSEDNIGRIIKVTGEVESANKMGIYLIDDEGNSLRVYIQKKTGIPHPELEPGQLLTVTGVLDKTEAGLRLLPRSQSDILVHDQENSEPRVLGVSEEAVPVPVSGVSESKESSYLLVFAGGVAVLAIAYIIKQKYLAMKQKA